MAPESDADVSKGIVRDAPRSSLPPGALYDSADFLLHEPGVAIKRGGTAYAGPALTGATYAKTVSYAEFPAGSQVVAIGDNGHLFTVTSGTTTDVGALAHTSPVPVDRPKLRIGGGKNLLIIPYSDGTNSPAKYDGTTIGTLGGSPSAGKYLEIYKTRIVLGNTSANPNRIFFSPTPDPEATWDTTDSWIDCDYAITGLAATSNMLLCFSQGHVERIIGSTPPPGSDMDRAVIGSIGCTDARSIAIQENNVMFANPRGVYLTNGSGFASLTDEGMIATYWQSLFSGYDPSTWVISAGIYRTFYFCSVVDNNGNLVASLMCNVPRKAWWRLTNIVPTCMAQAVGAQEELYYSDRSTNRVVQLSGIFTPSSSNKNDANGTAVAPLLEFQGIGGGPGLKAYGNGRLFYDMRDAATDNPTLAVNIAMGLEATTYGAVPESPLAETTDATRKRFRINKDGTIVNVKLQQSNASAKTEIYDLEIESRVYPQTRDGN